MNGTAAALRRPAIGILHPSRARVDRLGTWFEAEYRTLLRFAYFVCGNAAQAEDLVQEAFVRLYRAAPRLDDRKVGAYARTTIVNLSRSAHRRRRAEQRALERAGRPEAHDRDPGMPGRAARDEMWQEIQRLSPRQRAVIALRFYEDLPEKDVAAILGMSVGSVKKHSDRALTRLRARFGDGRQP